MDKIATTRDLCTELQGLLEYAQSYRPSRTRLARDLSALSERVGVVGNWNTAGAWYVTESIGQQLYFRATGSYQKNGKAMGVLVVVDPDRPRARPRAKRYSADSQWQRSFKPVPLAEVPPAVVAAARQFPDPVPANNGEAYSPKTNKHTFPIGAQVLVNGRDNARVSGVFPEGSTSLATPHYIVVYEGGGNAPVKVPMGSVGVDARVESPARWPKMR